jgi:hypothetical protein
MTLRLIAKPVAPGTARRASIGAGLEESEPPIRRPHLQVETRSPERVKLSEELAILNRPLEDEVEYYDEAPPSRAKPVFAVVAVLAAIGGAGYLLLAQSHRADDNAAAPPVRQGEQVSPIGAPPAASAATPVVPTNAPATEPAPTQAPVAPIAPGPAAEAASSTSGSLGEIDPEGDPPVPSAAAAGNPAGPAGTQSSRRLGRGKR